jgi:cell shape-determining protein MreC
MPNRLLCNVFDEMRECVKTSNFSYLLGLIEESQSLGNRMESHLYDIKDYNRLQEDIRVLKTKKKKLEKEIDELEALKPD